MTLQTAIVLAIVLAALAYAARRLVRSFGSKSGGACTKCDCGDKKKA